LKANLKAFTVKLLRAVFIYFLGLNVKSKTLVTLSLLVFVFLLGFSFSVQAHALRQQELNSPVSEYPRESYGVDSIEEYKAKIEQEFWLNYTRQMETLAKQYPELNFNMWKNPDIYRQAGASTYQPLITKSEQPFYAVVFNEPVVSLQVFSLSGLGLLGLTAVPPVKKRKQLRQALILGIMVLCVFSAGYFVGLTVAQTGTITIEPNSFQTEASYVIFKDGTTIKARNGTTGAIDYSGTDASTVIQSAINALGTSGGKIFIKAATYSLTSDLSPVSSLVIEGEGSGTEIVGAGGRINIDSKSNIVLRNLKINPNTTATTKHFTRIYNSSNVIIEGIYFTNPPPNNLAFVYIERSSYVVVKKCLLEMNYATAYGIYTSVNSKYILITENFFKITKQYNAIALYNDAQHFIVDSNIFWVPATATSYHTAISSSCSAYGTISNNVIYAEFKATDEAGIEVEYKAEHGTVQSHHVSIIGNIVRGTYNGIHIRIDGTYDATKRPYDIIVEGNIITGCTRGIVFDSGTKVRIENNDLLGNTNNMVVNFAQVASYVIKNNSGYVTENSGTATVANGKYIAHGIDSSLNIGPTNSTVTVTPYTVTYAGVPVVVGCSFVNRTHIRISAYWTNGTAITADAIQVWWKVSYP